MEGYAFETVTTAERLPLLAPMSEVAGRAASIAGAVWLGTSSGLLVGGATGVPPARVVVSGLGVAGTMAARGLLGLEANVVGVDVDLDRLSHARGEGVVTSSLGSSSSYPVEEVGQVGLIMGAALVPGARAPRVVTSEMIASMRPGSVIFDLAIDQGSCMETSRPTTISELVFVDHGVLHLLRDECSGPIRPNRLSRAVRCSGPRVRQRPSSSQCGVRRREVSSSWRLLCPDLVLCRQSVSGGNYGSAP